MRTQLNSETENWPKADGGLPSYEALFTDALLASYRRAIESVAAARGDIGAAALRLAAIWRAGGRLVYLGAGSSGLAAAADAAELPGTFGLDESHITIILAGGTAEPFRIDAAAEDGAAAGEQAMAAFGDLASDAVIAVSASGSTPPLYRCRRSGGAPSRRLCDRHRASPGFTFAVRRRCADLSRERRRGPAGVDTAGGRHRAKGCTRHALVIDGVRTRPHPSGPDGQSEGRQCEIARPRARNRCHDRRRRRGQGGSRASRGRRRGQAGDPDRPRRRQHERSRGMARG